MKLNIDGVQAFVAIAEAGGFQKAAGRLDLTQTALTRRLQKLEIYLGVRLLDRTTRSVALTAVGAAFLPQARRVVEELTQSVDRLKDMSRSGAGDITIACVPSMAYQQLPSVMRTYALAHPANRVRLLDRSSTLVTDAVRQGEAEFGITILLAKHADFHEETMLQDPFMLFCRRGDAINSAASITWRELRHRDLITVAGASGNRLLLDYQLARHRIDVRGRYEVEHLSTAIGLVSAGVGMAILPASTLLAGTHPEVRRISLVQPVIKRTLGLIRRHGVALSPAAQAFHDLLQTQMANSKRVRRAREAVTKGAAPAT